MSPVLVCLFKNDAMFYWSVTGYNCIWTIYMDLIHKSISYAVEQLTATQPFFTIFYHYRDCMPQFDYVKLHICKKKVLFWLILFQLSRNKSDVKEQKDKSFSFWNDLINFQSFFRFSFTFTTFTLVSCLICLHTNVDHK